MRINEYAMDRLTGRLLMDEILRNCVKFLVSCEVHSQLN